MAGLQVPLSTLRLAPRDALRMTRGQSGLLFLHCWRLSLFTLCRSPGAQAYLNSRFVCAPQLELNGALRSAGTSSLKNCLRPPTLSETPLNGAGCQPLTDRISRHKSLISSELVE